jgi:hypothetical protein
MKEKMTHLKSEYKVCNKCRKKLYQLQFESNNLFLKQEDKTDSSNEINIYHKKHLCSH